MYSCQLVKWAGDPPTHRAPIALILQRARGVTLRDYCWPPLWPQIAKHVFARVTPDPVGHPLCDEIVEWDAKTPPTVTYRRP
jgi:hypothetical protein